MDRIYMDHHATTPCDPRVFEAMKPYFTEKFGNATSVHHVFGREAAAAVEQARESVAALIGSRADEIVFTSGATESDNLAIKGVVAASPHPERHVVTVATEHRAVLETCRALERSGQATVTYLPVDRQGLIDLRELERAITDQTVVVSVMAANNEIGVLQPVAAIGAICAKRGVVFHTDATQAVGRIPVDVGSMYIHLASFSAHKMYGPKGVGALYVRRRNPRVRLHPQVDGGGHEAGLRSGTLPVPLIVGFGEASRLCARERAAESARVGGLRDRLQQGLAGQLEDLRFNGHPERRLPGNLSVTFPGVEIEKLLEAVGEVAVSVGSACSSAKLEPSHVLHALGVDEALAHRTVRFGLGRFNTEAEVDRVVGLFVRAVRRLRKESPVIEVTKGGVSPSRHV